MIRLLAGRFAGFGLLTFDSYPVSWRHRNSCALLAIYPGSASCALWWGRHFCPDLLFRGTEWDQIWYADLKNVCHPATGKWRVLWKLNRSFSGDLGSLSLLKELWEKPSFASSANTRKTVLPWDVWEKSGLLFVMWWFRIFNLRRMKQCTWPWTHTQHAQKYRACWREEGTV